MGDEASYFKRTVNQESHKSKGENVVEERVVLVLKYNLGT
jgi:hypothetical protein